MSCHRTHRIRCCEPNSAIDGESQPNGYCMQARRKAVDEQCCATQLLEKDRRRGGSGQMLDGKEKGLWSAKDAMGDKGVVLERPERLSHVSNASHSPATSVRKAQDVEGVPKASTNLDSALCRARNRVWRDRRPGSHFCWRCVTLMQSISALSSTKRRGDPDTNGRRNVRQYRHRMTAYSTLSQACYRFDAERRSGHRWTARQMTASYLAQQSWVRRSHVATLLL